MGEEYGETAPFLYFTHHGNPVLVEAVRAGRHAAFSFGASDDAAPDPQDIATYKRSRVQPELRHEGEHQALHTFYRELLTLRRTIPALTDPEAAREVTAWEAERVVLLHARGDAGEAIVILSFADTETRVSLPVPSGGWVTRLDASDVRFLGDGKRVSERLDADDAVELTLSPHAVLLFERAIRNG